MPNWPPSSWNGGRDQIGIGGRLRWNPQYGAIIISKRSTFASKANWFSVAEDPAFISAIRVVIPSR
jgi:hypothetical protein